jgi:hypothetical protein
MKAHEDNAESLKHILDTYCASLGKFAIVGKSSIYLSPNTHVDVRMQVCTTRNIMRKALTDKYSGLH